MTNDQINAAIDAILGPSLFVGLKKRGLWYRPGGHGYTSCEREAGRYTREQAKQHEYPHDEPVTIHEFSRLDYCNSLDACREFESKLTGDDRSLYIDILYVLCVVGNDEAPVGDFENQWVMFNATPLQRCEAFLRTKGHWHD